MNEADYARLAREFRIMRADLERDVADAAAVRIADSFILRMSEGIRTRREQLAYLGTCIPDLNVQRDPSR